MSISPDMMRRVTDSLGGLHDDMLRFLRDIVAIPSYESQLGEVGRAVWQWDPFTGKIEHGIL